MNLKKMSLKISARWKKMVCGKSHEMNASTNQRTVQYNSVLTSQWSNWKLYFNFLWVTWVTVTTTSILIVLIRRHPLNVNMASQKSNCKVNVHLTGPRLGPRATLLWGTVLFWLTIWISKVKKKMNFESLKMFILWNFFFNLDFEKGFIYF